MTAPEPHFLAASPCVAAFCATCGHAHVGGVCTYQVAREVIVDGERVNIEHDPCGCKKFVRETPTRCAFSCGCQSPECGCAGHCKRHADAIIAHRDDPDHELHALALTAHHPHD